MREPIISSLRNVTKEMIDAVEMWLEKVQSGEWQPGNECPFVSEGRSDCEKGCKLLFDNKQLSQVAYCPCYSCNFGEEATILVFTIICDVWKIYHR